jgi:hypothetical protein
VHAADANGLVVINQIDPITLVFTLPEEAVVGINRAQRSSQQPLKVMAYARDSQEVLATGKLSCWITRSTPPTAPCSSRPASTMPSTSCGQASTSMPACR